MTIENSGTPKTLDEAIKFALCVGPLSEITERSYLILKDFLSQRFGVAMLLANDPKVEEALKILFEEITRRDK